MNTPLMTYLLFRVIRENLNQSLNNQLGLFPLKSNQNQRQQRHSGVFIVKTLKDVSANIHLFKANNRKIKSNGLTFKALDSQSRGPEFKTIRWLQ